MGDVPTGSKNSGLNQPKTREPCTMHCTCYKKKRVESHALQANSCDNLNKGYCKLGQVKGGYRGPTAMLHPIHAPPDTQYTLHKILVQHARRVWICPGARDLESMVAQGFGDLESMVAQGFVKHGFKVLLHRVVDGPIANFTLPGLTKPVHLYPIYSCILGLSDVSHPVYIITEHKMCT